MGGSKKNRKKGFPESHRLFLFPAIHGAKRLIKTLNYLPNVNPELFDEIPPLSLLREFIGGCTFDEED